MGLKPGGSLINFLLPHGRGWAIETGTLIEESKLLNNDASLRDTSGSERLVH